MRDETKPCACCGRPVKSNLSQRCTGLCVIDGYVICDGCFKRLMRTRRTNELLFENLVREDKRTRRLKPSPSKACIENELRAFLQDLGYDVEDGWVMNGTLMMNAVKKGKDAVHMEFCDYATWMEG